MFIMCKDRSGLTFDFKNRPMIFFVMVAINFGRCCVGAGLSNTTVLPLMKFSKLLNDSNIPKLFDIGRQDMPAGLREDVKLTVGELIVKYGYPMEKHQVVTDDGYILSMTRIPRNGSVIFLMHGLLGSADDYVIAGTSSGLAYQLADEGYDVWMGNARGNKYSRNHQTLNPSEPAFWDFTWHEIGSRDLPAMIDHTLSITERNSLKYIGHSQGTTCFFVMISEKPEYNRKISSMIALSPVAFMSHATSPVVVLAPINEMLYEYAKSISAYEVFSDNNAIIRDFKRSVCSRDQRSEILCSNLLFLICGFSVKQLNVTNLPVIYSHVPSGASIKQFVHFAQIIMSGKFRKFDHGSSMNQELYGSTVPPNYNLKGVMVPVHMFYSDTDFFSHPKDVKKLYKQLGNPVGIYKVPCKPFNHLDFIWAKDFNTLIYKKLKNILQIRK